MKARGKAHVTSRLPSKERTIEVAAKDTSDAGRDDLSDVLGATVVIGLTHKDPAGDRGEQMFGTIEAFDEAGVRVRLRGKRDGEVFRLPLDRSAFVPAAPGSYRLKTTGETVVDPDYAVVWEIHPPRA